MKSVKSNRRLWISAVISFWLVVGVAAPFIFDYSGDELLLDSAGVVAAPSNSYEITSALVLDEASGTTVNGGTVAMVAAKGAYVTAQTAAKQLKAGHANLLLTGSELVLGTLGAPRQQNQTATSAPLANALQTGRFKSLGMRDGTVIVTLPDGHRERMTRATMKMLPASDGSLQAKGEGFWRGLRSKFTVKSGAVDKQGKVAVSLTLKASLLDLTYAGTVELKGQHSLSGSATMHLKDTEKLASALGTSWPIGTSVQEVLIQGPMRWRGDALAFDSAEVAVGESTGRGTLSLKTGEKNALIAGTLAFDALNVSPYLPASATDHRAIVWTWWNKLVGTLSRPAVSHINADIRLSAQSMHAGELSLGPAAATISMKDGRFLADIAEVALADARAVGQISIDFNRFIPKLSVRGRIENIATESWLKMLTGQPHLKGRGLMVAALTSQGESVQQILADLNGRIEYALPKGGQLSIALSKLASARDTAASQSPDAMLAQVRKGETAIGEFDSVWRINDGIAYLQKSRATHQSGELFMGGTYDLVRRQFDLRLLNVVIDPDKSSTIRKSKIKQAAKDSADPSAFLAADALPHATLLTLRSPQHARGNQSSQEALSTSDHPMHVGLRSLRGGVDRLGHLLSVEHGQLPRRGF